jgi:hypothetical protein
MPGFNLVRNSKVYFTTNVNSSTGVVNLTGFLPASTQELAVLNGFSFSQTTGSQTITVSEAGGLPARSQRAFNTSLEPVDFNFSTYIRPRGTGVTVDMDEKVLWNALFSEGAVNLAPTGIATVGEFAATASTIVRTGNTNRVTFTWTSINITVPAIAAGDKLTIGGVVNTGGTGFNGSATVVSITGSLAACTGIVVDMDIAPEGNGNPTTTTGTITFSKNSALVRNPVVSGGDAAHVLATVGLSNKNQLQKFGVIVIIDQTTYVIDNCALDQATIDFGLDGIAQVQWAGKGTVLRVLAAATTSGNTFGGSLTGTFTQATGPSVAAGNFITQKLSTATLKSTFRGTGTGNKTYTLALTGGSLTIANNIAYVIPESLGVVNVPIGYYTGTRAISGNITAYLKTGAGNTTNTLLNDLLAAPSEVRYYMELHVGGLSNAVKVEFEFPAVTMQVPTVDVQDVISTNIAFSAQGAVLGDSSAAALADGSTTTFYDLEATTDMLVRYYSAA